MKHYLLVDATDGNNVAIIRKDEDFNHFIYNKIKEAISENDMVSADDIELILNDGLELQTRFSVKFTENEQPYKKKYYLEELLIY